MAQDKTMDEQQLFQMLCSQLESSAKAQVADFLQAVERNTPGLQLQTEALQSSVDAVASQVRRTLRLAMELELLPHIRRQTGKDVPSGSDAASLEGSMSQLNISVPPNNKSASPAKLSPAGQAPQPVQAYTKQVSYGKVAAHNAQAQQLQQQMQRQQQLLMQQAMGQGGEQQLLQLQQQQQQQLMQQLQQHLDTESVTSSGLLEDVLHDNSSPHGSVVLIDLDGNTGAGAAAATNNVLSSADMILLGRNANNASPLMTTQVSNNGLSGGGSMGGAGMGGAGIGGGAFGPNLQLPAVMDQQMQQMRSAPMMRQQVQQAQEQQHRLQQQQMLSVQHHLQQQAQLQMLQQQMNKHTRSMPVSLNELMRTQGSVDQRGQQSAGDLYQYLVAPEQGAALQGSNVNDAGSYYTSHHSSYIGDLLSDPFPLGGGAGMGMGGMGAMGAEPLMNAAGGAAAAGGPDVASMLPPRFGVLPPAVLWHVIQLSQANPIIRLQDFDEKVVNKMALLVDKYGQGECFNMLDNLANRMRTKQSVMKNGPGYLDVAVSSHLDMLKAQDQCPSIASIQEYAQHTLSAAVYEELNNAIRTSHWLLWEHLDQGIVHLLKKLPPDTVGPKLAEISGRSFRNVDNVKGCIMSILNSKPRNPMVARSGGMEGMMMMMPPPHMQ